MYDDLADFYAIIKTTDHLEKAFMKDVRTWLKYFHLGATLLIRACLLRLHAFSCQFYGVFALLAFTICGPALTSSLQAITKDEYTEACAKLIVQFKVAEKALQTCPHVDNTSSFIRQYKVKIIFCGI